jgi:hypothetical protein
MQTIYFLAITVIGGLLFAFFATGWGSYKDKKLPDTPVMFRWFVAGAVAAGLAAYAYIFGSGGDVGEVIKTLSENLELSALTKLTQVATEEVQEAMTSVSEEIKVGMPNF